MTISLKLIENDVWFNFFDALTFTCIFQLYSYCYFQTFKDLMCFICALFIVAGCKGKNNILTDQIYFKIYLEN